ncbi:MAG: FHA domain-containing protein, partial [Planctomycetaceae bacterium]|nr:FHA domain-containing protein [Planctomycetaceae bacterium]
MPTLFVIRGADQGSRFDLTEPTIRVGRDPSNLIQIHDTEVSRHHAEIRRVDKDYGISDLNSSNGTFINGQRIRHHRLQSGDQLQVGRTLMLYTGPAEEPQEDLTAAVRIGPPTELGERSHIVRSLTQQEGSRIFDLQSELPQNSWLARARSNLQIMYRTALAVSHTLDIDQLLQRIMELIFEWVEADRGCIMLMDPANKTLQPKVRRTRKGAHAESRITISKTILDYVVERNEGVLTSDARQDERWDPGGSIMQMGVREAICVPMQGRYDVVGVIYIDTSTSAQQLIQQGGNRFTEDHLKLMIAIAHQAALAVEDTRYYSAMVQAERLAAIGQTIATLSHHIKNILQGIRGGSYLIEMGLKDHDEDITRKGWNIVDRNQNRISALVLDMLTFSKEREPDLGPANLNEVVADVVELMRVRADEEEVELVWQPSEPMPTLVFDAEGIHRSVLNVVTNAIDAVAEREKPRRVEVSSEYLPEDGLARVIVSDNGPGIPPEQMADLFSPFVSTKKSRGTGLGLPVSEKILREHGGQIIVDSDPGQGCRFTLELPATLPQDSSETIEMKEREKG